MAELDQSAIQLRVRELFSRLVPAPDGATIQRIIGEIYTLGLEPDTNQALGWLRQGSINGDTRAGYLFAMEAFKNSDPDIRKEGIQILQISAEKGYNESQFEMAKRDPENMMKWLTMAAEHHHVDAMYELGHRLVDDNYFKDYKNSFKWLSKYAERRSYTKFGSAYALLGHMYDTGKGTERDEKKAFEHYKHALSLVKNKEDEYTSPDIKLVCSYTITDLYERVADMYFAGIGTERNFEKAYEYYLVSAFDNKPDSFYQLYLMFRSGLGVPEDKKQAEIYFMKALNANCVRAQYDMGERKYMSARLSRLFGQHNEEKKLLKEAIPYLRYANDQEYLEAIVLLGSVYYELKEYDMASKYWTRAKMFTVYDERADVNYYLAILHTHFSNPDYEIMINSFEMFLSKYEEKSEIRLPPPDGIDYKDVLRKFKYSLEEVKTDYIKAQRCCQVLAKHNNTIAMFTLSWLYWTGFGNENLEKNETEAFHWYTNALLSDKTNELSGIRQELKAYENEIMVSKLTQISKTNDKEVDSLKLQLESSQKQMDSLKEQMEKLMACVEKMKEKQEIID